MSKDLVAYGIYPIVSRSSAHSSRSGPPDSATATSRRFFPNAIEPLVISRMGSNSKAPEGFTAGAGTGAAVGGVLGWLVGIGALAIPGIGPIVASSARSWLRWLARVPLAQPAVLLVV